MAEKNKAPGYDQMYTFIQWLDIWTATVMCVDDDARIIREAMARCGLLKEKNNV